jgi:Fuc2NAc and GlcNAc transferase
MFFLQVLMSLIALFASFTLTYFVRQYALARNIMDCPNHRSSHDIPIPRGGGVAFVAVFIVMMLIFMGCHVLSSSVVGALFFGGGLLAFLGFWDDQRDLSPKWRLLGHFFACGCALFCFHGMSDLSMGSYSWPTGIFLNIFAFFYLAWLLNLYNFMDGIDGLASIEAVSVCLGMACIYYVTGVTQLMFLPLILAASVLGFLYWNFPVARIFMGDAGSSTLGFILGVFSIQANSVNSSLFWSWLILMGVFVVDATVTLLRRMVRRDNLLEGHRTHAYQQLSTRIGRHVPVTLGALVINLLWLFPIALMVGLQYWNPCIGLLIAYMPLVIIAMQLQAGRAN